MTVLCCLSLFVVTSKSFYLGLATVSCFVLLSFKFKRLFLIGNSTVKVQGLICRIVNVKIVISNAQVSTQTKVSFTFASTSFSGPFEALSII